MYALYFYKFRVRGLVDWDGGPPHPQDIPPKRWRCTSQNPSHHQSYKSLIAMGLDIPLQYGLLNFMALGDMGVNHFTSPPPTISKPIPYKVLGYGSSGDIPIPCPSINQLFFGSKNS